MFNEDFDVPTCDGVTRHEKTDARLRNALDDGQDS